jgi:hypothetical protein
MSTSNPYQTPVSDVLEPSRTGQLSEPHRCEPGYGWSWIKDGFDIFKKNIGLWIGMVVIYMVLMIVLSIIPFVNFLLGLIAPVFTGGFMVACQRADQQGGFEFGDMFAGFKNQTGPLFMLGLMYIGLVIAISAVMGALIYAFGIENLFADNPESMSGMGVGISVVALLTMALFIPLAMGMWFAPALIVFHNIGPWTAFKLSLQGCLKNMIPFLIYGAILLVFGILAALPVGLGYLILVPVIIGSIYAGYKDIFIQA